MFHNEPNEQLHHINTTARGRKEEPYPWNDRQDPEDQPPIEDRSELVQAYFEEMRRRFCCPPDD